MYAEPPPKQLVSPPPGLGTYDNEGPKEGEGNAKVMAEVVGTPAPLKQEMSRMTIEFTEEGDFVDKSLYGHGYTPSGGSTCQQSSGLVMVLLFLITAGLSSLVINSMFEVRDIWEADQLELEKVTVSGDLSVDQAATFAALADQYNQTIQEGTGTNSVCDIPFFRLNSFGHQARIVTEYNDIVDWTSILLGIGFTMALIYMITKLFVVMRLTKGKSHNREQVSLAIGGGVTGKGGSPLDIDVGGHGYLETAQQRYTRVSLRGETIAYAATNAALDIPLLTFCLLYYIINRSPRGAACTLCIDKVLKEGNGAPVVPCLVASEVDSLPSQILVAIGVVSLSLLWNCILLLERWTEYIKFKRLVNGRQNNGFLYAISVIVYLLCYFFIALTPTIAYIYNYLGDLLFEVTDSQVVVMQFLSFFGAAVWGLLLVFILFFGGIDIGSLCETPFLFCEVCELCSEQCEFCSFFCCG